MSDKPEKLIPVDGNIAKVAVLYIQNDDGTYSKVDNATPLPVSGSFSPAGTQDIGDISKGIQTNDVKITLDGELILETNSGAIKSALEIIDNFVSGNRGLVTEDNSANIKTAIEAINTALQSGGITQSQLDNIKTAVEIIDNAISGNEMQVDIVGALPTGDNVIGKLAANSAVDIGDVTINNANGASSVNIQDGGNVITVDGTIISTPSGVRKIEGDEDEGSGVLPKPVLIGGDDGTDIKNINVNADTGNVQVDAVNTVAVDLGANNDVLLNAGENKIGKVESVHSSDSVSVAIGSIVFDAGDDLTTEKKTSAISLGSVVAHPDAMYLLAIEKPIENTAGNLTVYTYNLIKIDGSTSRDVSHSIHTIEKITDAATYQNYLIQGLFVGEEEIKLGMKFVTDSGAVTVKYRIYRL